MARTEGYNKFAQVVDAAKRRHFARSWAASEDRWFLVASKLVSIQTSFAYCAHSLRLVLRNSTPPPQAIIRLEPPKVAYNGREANGGHRRCEYPQ